MFRGSSAITTCDQEHDTSNMEHGSWNTEQDNSGYFRAIFQGRYSLELFFITLKNNESLCQKIKFLTLV